MGVPAFFRWLSRKYPSIIVNCVEEKPKDVDGVKIPIDSSQPNHNGVEFDNLYLDMNGIIHPCCHPENKPAPKNEDEMMVLIFEYIDRLFSIVRPRRLLYMAIDGVAPRAKMNQQRSRRFRASKEVSEKVEEIAKIRNELQEKGFNVPPEKTKDEHFDSNCITPGTPFMDRLAVCLHYYIHDRLNSDPGWKNITVILSDANSPGEGEHKIMDFIRKQRSNPDHDPNTHHCLCGADADLIMLGLATHEPNFTIIREEFKPNQPRPCELCNQLGHEVKNCMGTPKDMQGEFDELSKPMGCEQEFIFLRLNVLREYLERELVMYNLPFEFDIERALDDWVFMCFFVGNDFLPHLPSLEIREGAIDRLIRLYKQAVYKTGGYLTDSGMVNLDRVQLIMSGLGEVEDEIFQRRQQNELSFRRRLKEQKKRRKFSDRPAWTPQGQFAPVPIGSNPSPVESARKEAYQMRMQGQSEDNSDAARALKAMLRTDGKSEVDAGNAEPAESSGRGQKRKWDEAKVDQDSSEEEEPNDDVRLFEAGWKDRYYTNKFDVPVDNVAFRHKVAAAYAEGLCWVLQYYYQGCPSWKWFFPYHYAPFASDFVNIGDLSNTFEKGTQPFNPLEQLMGVFPAASKQHLPESFGELMCDLNSPILDFYPDNFKIDLNGKKFAWQGVALLPFVDEKRLLKALKQVYPKLTSEEVRRNVRGDDRLYVGRLHSGYQFLVGLYEGQRDFAELYELDTTKFKGMGGQILLAKNAVEPKATLRSPIPGCDDVLHNSVVCVCFRDPKYDIDYVFEAKRLQGAKEPFRVLKPEDLDANASRNWRPVIGMAPSQQRASLDMSGRRMLGHAVQHARGGGQYGSVPPPMQQHQQRSQFYNRGGGNSHNRQQQQQQYHHQQQHYGGNQSFQQYGSGGGGGGGGGRGGRGYGNNQGNRSNWRGGGGGRGGNNSAGMSGTGRHTRFDY